ncbi:ComEA family DNA-binding protein [Acinetobacter johnsonii]|uniref:ComEA family DNA-binding protein n=1 Tax=Acinetobacter johnsonii TaxID=40214 RepID=UPI0011E8064C|nr:ComEA family DNA-binding protein [Acinetobacter johnsonii]QEK36759.1 helix-hairpin-helix domain-containing protein [Acinetobacter johnsonii]
MIKIKVSLLIIALLLLSLLAWVPSGYAQSFDQNYLNWKAEQQAWDDRTQAPKSVKRAVSPVQAQPVSNANKISLNQASVDQLQQLQGVGLKKAQAIVAYRQKQGSFKTIDELQQVRGIGPAIFAKNKARLGL